MIARLGQNLSLKLLSLACSFALFLYVHKQRAKELAFKIPIEIRHDPATRLVDQSTAPRMVRVTLSGPWERLKPVEAGTKATVDLRGQGGGLYREPVEVQTPPELRDQIDVQWSPQMINVRLEGWVSRPMPVQVTFNVQPPTGLSLGTPTIEPATVQVAGWESQFNQVKRVQVVINSLGASPTRANSLGSASPLEVVAPVRPVDNQGIEVDGGIRVQPTTVKVTVPLQRLIWSKPVYVSPTLGELPPTVRLERISITPRRLTIRGPESAVGSVQYLETEPISIPPTAGLVDREVRVSLPVGVKTEERPWVRVLIVLQGGSP
jgi:YbbR domain-containing protein